MAWVVVVAAGAMCRNQGPGTGGPMLMAGICLCITIIVIITAGGATAIDTAGKLRPQGVRLLGKPTVAGSGVRLISTAVPGADVSASSSSAMLAAMRRARRG